MDDKLLQEAKPKSQLALWLLAGGLAVFLVIYHTAGGEDQDNDKQPLAKSKPVAAAPTPSAAKPRPRRSIDWPAISLDDFLEFNPFQPRQTLENGVLAVIPGLQEQEDVQVVKRALEESRETKLQQQELARELASPSWKVSLLYETPQGAAALIGDQVVHQGDTLQGYRVVAIDANGVTLEPLTDGQ